ncbi:Dbl homology domain-containing protein [Neoconidiobolus thromboides FSU 785]|nr:Dbl homology domain-containing protein [Neoconidiobolus thromboides FSU 785]
MITNSIKNNTNTSLSLDSCLSNETNENLKTYNENYTKRLDPINELIETETSFLNDLTLIREVYIPKIKESCLWSKSDPNVIINNIFFNYESLLEASENLVNNLRKRREEDSLMKTVGDILLSFTNDLKNFGYYASHAQFSMKYWLSERINETTLAKYLLKCELDKRVNKRNLDTFLTRPTYRLGQYPLLIKEILKYTEMNSKESKNLLESLARFESCLSFIDSITDKEEKRLQLKELQDRMFYKNGDISTFGLTDENREIIHEGNLIKPPFGQQLTLFLFDHALFLTKAKRIKFTNIDEYELIQKPIELDQLHLEEYKGIMGITYSKSSNDSAFTIVKVNPNTKIEKINLICTCSNEKEIWMGKINKQRDIYMAKKAMAKFKNSKNKSFTC